MVTGSRTGWMGCWSPCACRPMCRPAGPPTWRPSCSRRSKVPHLRISVVSYSLLHTLVVVSFAFLHTLAHLVGHIF